MFSLLAGQPLMAQESGWADTLKAILQSGKPDSLLAQELGDKAFFLTVQRKLSDADRFIEAQALSARKSGNKSQMAYAIYTSAVRFYTPSAGDTMLNKLKEAVSLSEQGSNLLIRIKSYRLLAQYYETNSRIEEAKEAIGKALLYAGQLKDENEMAKVNLTYGIVLARTEDQKGALERYIAAISYLENSVDFRSLAVAYNAVANILFNSKDIDKARLYYQKNLSHCRRNYKPYLTTAYLGMATWHYTSQSLDSALHYYTLADSAMQVFSEFSRLHVVYTNKASIYQQLGRMDSAAVYHRKSIDLAGQLSKLGFVGRMYVNYASFLLKISELDSALKTVEKGYEIATEEKDEEGCWSALKQKAEILFAMRDYDGASHYYNLTLQYKDSVVLSEKRREINRLVEEYESVRKQSEIVALKNEKRIQLLEIEKQQAIIHGNMEAARQNQSEIDLLNKENIINALKLQQQKEEIDRKNMEARAREQDLSLSRQREELKEREIEQQKNSKYMIIGGSFMLVLFLGMAFNQYRLSQKRRAESEKHQMQHQLSEMKIEALRAQMNPHFIFNALNSINRYIIRSDKETASDYLVKFSKLMRLVLENSRSTSVTLQNETEALRLYIEMEQLRFDHKFDYSISIDPLIDRENTSIPPLVLQPYVENAIWHGLLNKGSKGRVDISIRLLGEDRLFCIIEDNGVGRERASELRSQTLGSQRSFGTEITRERIKLLNGDDRHFKIIDLYDDQKNPSGTRVEITLHTITAQAA
ncbi:MAG: histidine kinase [Bacteroidia bacterium]|nr:histidine kinase [Bacteroidia bacterium]